MPKAEFDKEWLYKPVRVTGIFDHDQEIFVQRTMKGEQGYEIVTPLFTGVDEATG
jgi:cytochrome oxidase assembly protein ShyY1